MKALFPPPDPYMVEGTLYVDNVKIASLTRINLVIDVEEYFENSTKKQRKQLANFLLE